MNQLHDGYEVIPFPRMRRLVVDVGRLAHQKYAMQALVEVDVTKARQYVREVKEQTGEALSFTAFLAACVGTAVGENKHVQAYRNWRGQLVVFDDVDIGVMVERDKGGQKFPVGYIIRTANKKTVRDIHDEIRAIQAKPVADKETRRLEVLTILPGPVRRLLLSVVTRNPQLGKQIMGTVALTAVGMFGRSGGWGLTMPTHSLCITVGGIVEKPGVVEGRIVIREYVDMTLAFDHEIMDGAPAARFVQRLIDLVEDAHGLCS